MLKHELHVYENLEVNFVSHHIPTLYFFDEEGNPLDEYEKRLNDLDHLELLQLLKEHASFVPKTIQTEYGEATATDTFQGHKYEFYNVGNTYEIASAFAQSLGGHLVTITTEAENEFVSKLTETHAPLEILSPTGVVEAVKEDVLVTSKHPVWLGAADIPDESAVVQWNWSEGPDAGVSIPRKAGAGDGDMFSHWARKEPNNSGRGEHCAVMDPEALWNDVPCFSFQKLVVEYVDTAGAPALKSEL